MADIEPPDSESVIGRDRCLVEVNPVPSDVLCLFRVVPVEPKHRSKRSIGRLATSQPAINRGQLAGARLCNYVRRELEAGSVAVAGGA